MRRKYTYLLILPILGLLTGFVLKLDKISFYHHYFEQIEEVEARNTQLSDLEEAVSLFAALEEIDAENFISATDFSPTSAFSSIEERSFILSSASPSHAFSPHRSTQKSAVGVHPIRAP